MKTNKQEREAIAIKFYRRMESQMITKNEAFKKTATYKKLTKLKAERNKILKESEKLNVAISKEINDFNQTNPSEYFSLTDHYDYRNNQNSDYRLNLESSWSVQNSLCNAILIAQVGAETVEDMMKILEQEVSL